MSDRDLNAELLMSPDEMYGELFEEVQLKGIFEDSKTFVDMIPKVSPEEILQIYKEKKNSIDFDLFKFVKEYFSFPSSPTQNFQSDRNVSTVEHINRLWDLLIRPADEFVLRSSRISLPYPYIVPGGRFREMFYWDSYFTMLGLSTCPSRISIIENMIDNFSYLIEKYGFIPNGCRTYFLSRSQPPFFSLMIQLLANLNSNPSAIRLKYFAQLLKEYQFWMRGDDQLNETNLFNQHVVRLSDGRILNRYYDRLKKARPESYSKEIGVCERASTMYGISRQTFYFHNRTACESGWDFSSRWFKDGKSKELNEAANIIPIDLNCLIFFMEDFISSIYNELNNIELSQLFRQLADSRKETIQKLFWSDQTKYFHDYNLIENSHTPIFSLAGVYPLYFQIATTEQAEFVRQRLEKDFLREGGLQTTLTETGQQWDSPMGWPPLHWICYQALKNYHFDQLANQIRSRWLNLNDHVFKQTGKMMEKYNVVQLTDGGGGYYPAQDGFGWTNGVYLKLFYD